MVFVRKWPIFNLFFWGNIGNESVSYDILERKNAFLSNKNKKLKKWKNWHFLKGVNPWFWSKNVHFFKLFFFRQYRQGKCLLRYSRTKNPFLGYKNKKIKKSKNWHFPGGLTHGFGSNMAIFQFFLLRQYRPGKYLLRYSRTKKRLSRL